MSFRYLFAVAALAVTALTTSGAAQSVAPTPGPAEPPPPELSPEQIFESVGWIVADRNHFADFGMNESEMAAFQKGLLAGLQGQHPPANFEEVQGTIQQFIGKRVQDHAKKAAAVNHVEEEKFLATCDQNPTVKQSATGLRYEILAAGTDPKPTAKDTVVAHYTLSYADGTVVESSKESGQPAEFSLARVVPAWTEGLQLIGSGGHIKLYVPSKLGYGDTGSQGIPPGKLLVFDVELISVKPAGPAPIEPLPMPGSP